jgi:hypothetical protein
LNNAEKTSCGRDVNKKGFGGFAEKGGSFHERFNFFFTV